MRAQRPNALCMDYHDPSSALQLVIIYYHVATINTCYATNDDHIRSQSGDLNPGLPGTKRPLCHLSYHPLTLINFFFIKMCQSFPNV